MKTLGKFLWVIIALLVLLAISQYAPDFAKLGEKRLELSRQNSGAIEIAVMQTPGDTKGYLNGILLAVEEINQRPGQLLGSPLQIHLEQEGNTFEDTKSTIRKVVANPKIAAVLGHRRSSIAVPASVIYERSKLVFITPFATAKSLTGHGFKYVFRMAPNNGVMADQLASVAQTLGYKRIVTLYSRDELSREVAFLFEDAVIKQGIEIAKSTSFSEKDANYRPIISQFNSEPFDALFIASSAKPAALMADQLREMGIHKPILGSDTLNKAVYTEQAGEAAKNTIIPSIYHTDKKNPISRNFMQSYKNKYEEAPDHNAAQGYDSVMLLAAAIERAGSTLPPLLSTTLHYMPAWVGVTGIHAFDEDGELQGKKYFFQAWQKQSWQDLPAIHVPYLLNRFTQNQRTETNYPRVFTHRMHDDEHKTHLLALAQQILGFKRIGLIYEDTDAGRTAAHYELLQSLAKKNNISIVKCIIPFSQQSRSELEHAMLACYGKLSLSSDALFIPAYHGIDGKLLEKLNSSLTFFKIPAISLNVQNSDPNISLLLTKRTDIDTQNLQSMQVYSELLKGMKVHEFAEFLKNLPEITLNLTNLQYQGFSDRPILELSPDNYIYSNPPSIKESTLQ